MYQFRNFAIWIVIGLLLVALFSVFQNQVGGANATEVSYSKFLEQVTAGDIKSVTYSGESMLGKKADGSVITAYGPPVKEDLEAMKSKGIDVTFRPQQSDSLLSNALIYWLPMLVLIGVWIFFIRQMQSGSGKAMGFGKAKPQACTQLTYHVLDVSLKDMAITREAWPQERLVHLASPRQEI